MNGPAILASSLSTAAVGGNSGRHWQYHSRSDHHSKVACWGIVFDVLLRNPTLRRHIAQGRVAFGINHEMRDFENDRKKNLDLVLCTPAGDDRSGLSLSSMVDKYSIVLDADQRAALDELPELCTAGVGSVLMALEAKACMTAHQKALPRLYDELNSSHLTVHGSTDQAIAVGFAMVNVAERFLSPGRNAAAEAPVWNSHQQPRAAEITIDKLRQLKRRSKPGDVGYDALAIVLVDCANDGSPVSLVERAPAPPRGDIYHYDSMIERVSHIYSTRFKDI